MRERNLFPPPKHAAASLLVPYHCYHRVRQGQNAPTAFFFLEHTFLKLSVQPQAFPKHIAGISVEKRSYLWWWSFLLKKANKTTRK